MFTIVKGHRTRRPVEQYRSQRKSLESSLVAVSFQAYLGASVL